MPFVLRAWRKKKRGERGGEEGCGDREREQKMIERGGGGGGGAGSRAGD